MIALFQILVVVGLSFLLGVVFNHWQIFRPIKVIDCLLPIFLFFIYRLTLNANHISQLPIFLIPWLCVALIILIYTYLTKPALKVGKYLMMVWRIGDLYFLITWAILILFKIIG